MNTPNEILQEYLRRVTLEINEIKSEIELFFKENIDDPELPFSLRTISNDKISAFSYRNGFSSTVKSLEGSFEYYKAMSETFDLFLNLLSYPDSLLKTLNKD